MKLAPSGDEIVLTVSDDGVSMDFDELPPPHLGLAIMRERAQLLGGRIAIESQPGRGTTVMATFGSLAQG